ncbi:MAG: hypothetical protein AAF471_09370 [Myxococcota bacterium]
MRNGGANVDATMMMMIVGVGERTAAEAAMRIADAMTRTISGGGIGIGIGDKAAMTTTASGDTRNAIPAIAAGHAREMTERSGMVRFWGLSVQLIWAIGGG